MAEDINDARRASVDTRPQIHHHRIPSGNITLHPPSPSTITRLPSAPSPSAHRQSFEQVRGVPPSPRQSRHLSLSQAQMMDLINYPPTAGRDGVNDKFKDRDWRTITVGELSDETDFRWTELDESIEEATNILADSGAHAILVRNSKSDHSAVATFDYRDLNQYLLFATGQLQPDEPHLPIYQDLAKKSRAGGKIPLRDAKELGGKEVVVTLPHTADLSVAIETFGGGVHRIVLVKEGTDYVVGMLSQLRLVKFLWENGRSFPVIDQLYPRELQELGIGGQNLISINGDRLLKDALCIMNNEGISSLAVVDNQYNVVGNISNVDIKLLTKSSSAPLLENTCIHFISVILSARGMNDGKDSYPVFHVHPYSTLAHTVAKLVATKAHRMWVVDSPTPVSTPNSSTPNTPLPHMTTHPINSHSASVMTSAPSSNSASQPPPITHGASPISIAHPPAAQSAAHLSNSYGQTLPPLPPLSSSVPTISASALPGAHLSGRLSGVVSLTDVLNLFARASGLQPNDPEEARRARRGSSASSRSGISERRVLVG